MISGREFTEADTPDSQLVAVVNQAFVDRYWPGESAIGKQVTDWGNRFTIVGVARNAKYRMLTYPSEPVIYLPIYQIYHPTQDTTIHLRTTGDPRTMASSVGRDHPSAQSGVAAVQCESAFRHHAARLAFLDASRLRLPARSVFLPCYSPPSASMASWLTALANARGNSASAWRSARRREASTVSFSTRDSDSHWRAFGVGTDARAGMAAHAVA